MAVTITTEFYEYDTPAWHDVSKVVFTSPNITSPNTAGLRSHILPGELELATWYEDTSKMYRIYSQQVASVNSYYPAVDPATTVSGFDIRNSIKFELTFGENYDNRLTAWDNATHSTTDNFLISTGRVKVSAVAYRYDTPEENPTGVVEVFAPSYNTTLSGNGAYYGDFDMIYANPTTGKAGDVLIFSPWLHNIDATVPYDTHDFVITLHYTYT